MKKNFLICRIIFSFFILAFSSCINSDFDLNDDKMDPTVDVGDSISVPVGDIERIVVYDKLVKLYDKIKVREDGVLYVKYDGTFGVEFPDFEFPKIEEIEINVNEIPLSNGELPFVDVDNLIENSEEIKISKPDLTDGELEFDPVEIGFSSLTLDVGFIFSGVVPNNDDAQIVVTVKLPESYVVDGERELTKEFPFDGKPHSLGKIKVNSYKFAGDGTLSYRVGLKKNGADLLTVNDPQLKFTLKAESPNPPEISWLKCHLSGSKTFSGTESGFGDLLNVFGENDTLQFSAPSLSLHLNTNLETSFKLGISMSDGGSSPLKDSWEFKKPSHDTVFAAKPEMLKDLISTPFPEKLDYNVSLEFDKEEMTRLLPKDQMVFSADYSFEIPFSLDRINLSLNDTITDLFSEDTYEQIFRHIGDIFIKADLKSSIGNGDITMDISAAILDSAFVEITPLVTVKVDKISEDRDSLLTIEIKSEEAEKMKKARHLAFTFRLSGSGDMKKDDYIEVKNLRIISNKGLHYEL